MYSIDDVIFTMESGSSFYKALYGFMTSQHSTICLNKFEGSNYYGVGIHLSAKLWIQDIFKHSNCSEH